MKLSIIAAALLASSGLVQAEGYWTRDPQAWPTQRTEVQLDAEARVWCKGAWGCIHRNPTYYPWDYHLTKVAEPSVCVAIVDSSLPPALRRSVAEHELCHCKGWTHSSQDYGRFEACPE